MQKDDTIRLWTVQDRAALLELVDRGELTGREYRASDIYIDFETGFEKSYRWLMAQMQQRIPSYQGGWPVWFWPERPDLRCKHGEGGARLVLFEVVLPRCDTLVSDFDGWHAVLNNWYLGFTEEESEGDHTQEEITASWQNIFELEKLAQGGYWTGNRQDIQVVAERFTMAQVRNITEFISR